MAGHKAFIRVKTRRDDQAIHTRLFMASVVPSAQQALMWTARTGRSRTLCTDA